MHTIEKNTAQLLLDDYHSIDDLKQRILTSSYATVDPLKPTLRFRGTVIDARDGLERIVITGWQRNVSRLRKMDVSLPTIITLVLDKNRHIREIELDESFKGSKGLMCSHRYLNRNLKTQVRGQVFDGSFLGAIKQEKTHCSHLFEVLSGMYSFYRMAENRGFAGLRPRGFMYEEEAIDSYTKDGTIHSLGTHMVKGLAPVCFRLSLHDIMGKVGFAGGGALRLEEGVAAVFRLNGEKVLKGMISINNQNCGHPDLLKFLLQCIAKVKDKLCPAKGIRMFNTNLYPRAYIGMLIQAVAIRLFNNNYNYIMHALTALQRFDEVPLCVGALTDQAEADQYFPGFDFTELI
jgi:hypothetical protein